MIIIIKTNRSRVIVRRFNCGFDSIRRQIINIRIKFYLLLILFILFDVELLFIYRYMICSRMEYTVIYLLTTMLLIRYLYELNEGILSWV